LRIRGSRVSESDLELFGSSGSFLVSCCLGLTLVFGTVSLVAGAALTLIRGSWLGAFELLAVLGFAVVMLVPDCKFVWLFRGGAVAAVIGHAGSIRLIRTSMS